MNKILRQPWQWFIAVWIVFFAFSIFTTIDHLENNVQEEIVAEPSRIHNQRNVAFIPQENGGFPRINFKEPKLGFGKVRIDLPYHIKTGVVEIEIDPSAQLWKNQIYVRAVNAKYENNQFIESSESLNNNRWIPLKGYSLRYRVPLSERHHKAFIVLEFRYASNISLLPVNSIKIKPATVYDFVAGPVGISLLVILAMFLPGIVFFVMGIKPQLPLPIAFFLYSAPVNLLSLVLSLLTGSVSVYLVTWLLLIVGGAIFIRFLGKARHIDLKQQWHDELNLFVFILLVISVLLPFVVPGAYFHFNHDFSALQTFSVFTAHDSVLQHVNAKAVLQQSFDAFYGSNAKIDLLVEPQDREILPGLLYATIMQWLKFFINENHSQSFYPYAVFFYICHSLLLCAIFTCVYHVNRKLAYLVILILSTSPIFWMLFNVAWFKLTGSAMLVSGAYLVARYPEQLKSWVLAGILFGLAKNFHGGHVLLLPIIAIWLMYWCWRYANNLSIIKVLSNTAVLTLFAVIIIFPWNFFVKIILESSTHKLFSFHYLDGVYVRDSLPETFEKFFQKYPLEQQLTIRFERFLALFDLHYWYNKFNEMLLILNPPFISQAFVLPNAILLTWIKFSATYIIPAFIFYFVFAFIVFVVQKITGMAAANNFTSKHNNWFISFCLVQFFNLFFIVLLTFGSVEEIDYMLTWNTPVLPYLLLICAPIIWLWHKCQSTIILFSALGLMQLSIILLLG